LTKKRTATLAVCAVLLFCVIAAGCSGPNASPTQSAANESTKTTSAQAATSTQAVTPSASVTSSPSATHTPSVTLAPTVTPTPAATSTPANIPATGVVSLYFYYRPDCPYCQALEPQIKALQTQYAGKVSVQWIQSTGVVPTLVLFNKSGVQVYNKSDPGTTAPVIAVIDSLLASG